MNIEYMKIALKEALKASKRDEVPVGAVIVYQDKCISKGYNNREHTNNILGHAEIIAIKKASKKLHTWKLMECDLYVTLKPCKMCEEVIKQSRIRNVFYILEKPDSKREYDKTNFNLIKESMSYQQIIGDYFKTKRSKKED
ncbi:MAG: nucleoside deaminase [Bacilli bacterium]